MAESVTERFIRAERTVYDLIERLPKELVGQVLRMLAQNIAHYRAQTGVDIPVEETMILFNSPAQLGIDQATLQALSAEALEDLASILAWQAGEEMMPPGPRQTH
ncbi:MAG: hypothetical protein KC708_26045 [Anaerolineae bacterium]|nr:hypothetical protein [Anaerolineae bacterium]